MRRAAAAMALLLPAWPAAAYQHLRSAPVLPITRLGPGPVTTGDFNGDGRRDIAYGLHNPTGVAVLLGDGNGGYAEPLVSRVATMTSSSAEAIVAADFNGDGRLDLALADFATGPAVYLGLGDGRFAGQSLGGEPLSLGLAAGDFDGDGRRDLALARRGFTSVAQVLFYRGDGQGGFAAPVIWNLPALLLPYGVVARDFDGDGRDDLAVADDFGDAVAILIGSPTLAPDVRGPFPAGAGPQGIDAGDLDGDGRLDVVTASQRGRSLAILLGDGSGSLGAPLVVPGPADARKVLVGHFDGDGRLDVAVSGAGLWTYAGTGAGGLTAPRRYGVSGAVAVAELTGDGPLDLVAGESLLRGDGAGGFDAQRTFPVPPDGRAGLAADFDRDGRVDAAIVHGSGMLSILRGDGQGGLGAPATTLTGTDPVDLAAGDFDRDGWPDLAVAHAGTLDVVVLTNDRAGGFTRRSYPVGGVPQSLATGDFGGDGLVDIAVANDTAGAIVVLHGLPDGTFAFGGTTVVGTGSRALVAGRFNADARTDLAWFRAPAAGAAHLSILAGTGGETFVPGPPVSLLAAEHALAAADLDADGRLDLVAGGDQQPFPEVSGLGVRLGDGQGGVGAPVFQPVVRARALAVADFTQDGRLDVAAYESSSAGAGVHLLQGQGDGACGLFESAPVPVGGAGRVLFASDFDGDGRTDVAALVERGDTLTLLLGRDAASGADLALDVQDAPDPVAAGQAVRYVATAVNRGPSPAQGVRLQFRVPAGLAYQSHTPNLPVCAQEEGLVTCHLPALAVNGPSFTLAVDAATSPESGGQPLGWADVRALSPEETAPADNFVVFRTAISPVDLALSAADTPDPVQPGQAFRYTLLVVNQGAFTATRVITVAELPAGVTLVGLPDPACGTPDDVTIVCGLASLFPGQSASFDVDVQAATFTSVSLAAEVGSDQPDVDPADNSAVEETRMELGLRGELAHGDRRRLTLPALAPSEERFWLRVPARSSFEVALDEASGDAAAGGLPIRLERLGADASTVLQFGAPAGAGPARALRWQNTTDESALQVVRVRSQGCSTDCGPDDGYRLRTYETTAAFARFNTTGDQEAVVLLHNPAPAAVSGTLWFWGSAGTPLGSRPFTLPARRSLVLNVATLLPGRSGSITLTHDGGYGALSGKAVAIEPATGFSYDTPLVTRPR